MPVYTEKLPQENKPIVDIDIFQLITVLPDTIPYPVNVWVSDNLEEYGRTTETIRFLIEQDEEPSNEIRQFFSALTTPLGIPSTVNQNYRDNRVHRLLLYEKGELIIDKNTFAFTKPPTPLIVRPVLTADETKFKFPATIPYLYTIYFTGSIVKNGYSGNDADFIIFSKKGLQDSIDHLVVNPSPTSQATIDELEAQKPKTIDVESTELNEIRKYLEIVLNYRANVGNRVMFERDTGGDFIVYLYRLYEDGNLRLTP